MEEEDNEEEDGEDKDDEKGIELISRPRTVPQKSLSACQRQHMHTLRFSNHRAPTANENAGTHR